MERLIRFLTVALLFVLGNEAKLMAQSADYPYAPPWFGPYALPVPLGQAAFIPRYTELTPEWRSLLNKKQKSQSLHIELEVPLLPEVVSVKGWGCVREFYHLSSDEAERMNVPPDKLSGSEGGDYYLQTRIRLLQEANIRPNVVLNITLKTAAATTATTKRFYDTPGYAFSLELGKDWLLGENNSSLRLRTALHFGFLCWETGQTSRQNDAYHYGAELIGRWRGLEFKTELAGYTGWMQGHSSYRADYGDRPFVVRGSLGYRLSRHTMLRADVESGLRAYPYTHLGLGLQLALPSLTPRLSSY